MSDISNQKKEKKKEEEQVELSKNAQFRAIKPSPSILSFVEDNVRCSLIWDHFSSLFSVVDILIMDIEQLLGRRRDIELRRAGYNTELSAPLDNIPFSTSSERERIEESVCSHIKEPKLSASFYSGFR